MNIANTMTMVQAAAAYSVLKSANRQPELALQLLLQSLPLQTPRTSGETLADPVQAASPTEPGQIVDTTA